MSLTFPRNLLPLPHNKTMIFCLFNLHLVSFGFGVGEAWNGGERGEEGSQQKNPRSLRHGGSVGLLWMSVLPRIQG